MDKSANKIRGRRPLDKQTVDITLGITIIIYLLPKELCFNESWIQKFGYQEMFCYHNENTDFANLKFALIVLIISYKDLVTHYNTVDNP